MSKEIKFGLLYRDMWQSSGKYVPTVAQLKEVAPAIIDMGCFARVETNGGGFEQINLLFGENPNNAVREWTKPFNDAGIQTHMLERGLNGIRMNPVPADVRQLMFKVKKKQGTDIARSFDGLNDPRNLELSIKYAKEAGMISQAALSITVSEVHTVEYFTNLADKLIEMGTDEICIKDMAGIGRPASIGKIIKNIKSKHPNIPITYHGHAGPGFQMATILEAAYAGVDYIDTAMEPLAWGTGHADILAVQAMLKDAGFKVADINMKAYMKVRSLTQKFIDDFLGFYINPKNRLMNSLLIAPGLPGGMMGSLMSDLETNLKSLNRWFTKNDKPEITIDDLLIKLFDEVSYVWPKIGNPPLVTPFSQYVKNLALMNVMQLERGRDRWSMIADNIWDMIVGRTGQLPGTLDPEIKKLIKDNNKEYFTGNPQDLYPNQLDEFRAEMKQNGWDFGQDDEELFELAMHPEQYRAYKSGAAKEEFEKDLEKKRAKKEAEKIAENGQAPQTNGNGDNGNSQPRHLVINVGDEEFMVHISYPETDGVQMTPSSFTKTQKATEQINTSASQSIGGAVKEVIAPLEGKFFLTKDSSETAIKVGDIINEGDIVGYIESMKTYNAVAAEDSGKVVEICIANGDSIDEDDILVKLQ